MEGHVCRKLGHLDADMFQSIFLYDPLDLHLTLRGLLLHVVSATG